MSNYFYIFHAWKITAFALFTIRQVSSVFFNFTKILPFFILLISLIEFLMYFSYIIPHDVHNST